MRTNLIQSYLYDNNISKQYNANKAQTDFDIHKELANRTFIKPLPSHGEFVKNSIFDEPSELLKDWKYEWKSFNKALKGNANDHQLGTLNDFGMKLGGVAIASYLLTRRATPALKFMEFVGLTTFFSAMSLWPKLAIQIPAKLIHGFNVRQEYRDNNGTKKRVFLDHQFIPWDLYSDEEINKIGDRMRVPKDMKNRRDYIQEKMRKIALQNNTLWMLTAGFATPIMSALLCNAIENPLKNYMNDRTNKKAEALLSNIEAEAEKFDFRANTEKLNKLLEKNSKKQLSPELLSKIGDILSQGLDPVTSKILVTDLEHNLGKKDIYNVNADTVKKISEFLNNKFSKLPISNDELSKLIPNSEDLLKYFEENGLLKDGISDFSSHLKFIHKLIDKNANNLFSTKESGNIRKKIEILMNKISSSIVAQKDSELKTILKSSSANVLSEELQNVIENISSTLNAFRAKNAVLTKFAYMKAAQAQETVLANAWNELAGDLPNLFGITQDEMNKSRFDRILTGNLLREKFEKIVSDDKEYTRVVKTLESKLSKLQSITEFAKEEKITGTAESSYKNNVHAVYDEAAEALSKLNMPTLARRLVGYDKLKDSSSLKNIQLSFVVDRVRGVKSSFYQILNTLDVYRRISKNEFLEVLGPEMPLETKEELVEMCKQLLIDGHTSDYASKFHYLRNSEFNPKFANDAEKAAYTSQITTNMGKVVNKKLGKRRYKDLVELPNDSTFFKDAMKLMYGGNIHSDTKSIFRKNSLVEENLMKYRQEMYDFIGGDIYFARPFHTIAENGVKSTSEYKFLLKGCALDDMLLNVFKNKFNSNKWLKTFSVFGAGLLGISILSQFFFGHMPNNKADNKEVK